MSRLCQTLKVAVQPLHEDLEGWGSPLLCPHCCQLTPLQTPSSYWASSCPFPLTPLALVLSSRVTPSKGSSAFHDNPPVPEPTAHITPVLPLVLGPQLVQ